MTSRRPCWRSKQRNGGHVGGVKYSFGDWTLFLCKFLLLFHYAKYGFWSHERTHYKLKLINQNDSLTDYIYRLKFHGTLGGRSFLIVLGVLIIVFFSPPQYATAAMYHGLLGPHSSSNVIQLDWQWQIALSSELTSSKSWIWIGEIWIVITRSYNPAGKPNASRNAGVTRLS